MIETTNGQIAKWIEHEMFNDRQNFVTDMGYLLVPDDPMLCDEARSNLKRRLVNYRQDNLH